MKRLNAAPALTVVTILITTVLYGCGGGGSATPTTPTTTTGGSSSSGAAITLNPASLSLTVGGQAGVVTVGAIGSTGNITSNFANCGGIVTPLQPAGTLPVNDTFTPVAAGSCQASFSSANGETATLPITVAAGSSGGSTGSGGANSGANTTGLNALLVSSMQYGATAGGTPTDTLSVTNNNSVAVSVVYAFTGCFNLSGINPCTVNPGGWAGVLLGISPGQTATVGFTPAAGTVGDNFGVSKYCFDAYTGVTEPAYSCPF